MVSLSCTHIRNLFSLTLPYTLSLEIPFLVVWRASACEKTTDTKFQRGVYIMESSFHSYYSKRHYKTGTVSWPKWNNKTRRIFISTTNLSMEKRWTSTDFPCTRQNTWPEHWLNKHYQCPTKWQRKLHLQDHTWRSKRCWDWSYSYW